MKSGVKLLVSILLLAFCTLVVLLRVQDLYTLVTTCIMALIAVYLGPSALATLSSKQKAKLPEPPSEDEDGDREKHRNNAH